MPLDHRFRERRACLASPIGLSQYDRFSYWALFRPQSSAFKVFDYGLIEFVQYQLSESVFCARIFRDLVCGISLPEFSGI